MANSQNAQVLVEAGQTLVDFVAMTTADRKIHKSVASTWSGKSGFAPQVLPNGVVTGANLVTIAVSGANNVVDVAAFTAYSKGSLKTVAGNTGTITRGATPNIAKISSITMNDAGAIVVVAGTDSTDASINESRASAGGPPLIPVDSVEIAQIRFTGTGAGTAAPITAAQIFQVVGQHHERYDYPAVAINNIGEGSSSTSSAKVTAFVDFDETLPESHTGSIARKTWIKYYTPTFAAVSKASDFKPVATTYSSSSSSGYAYTTASSSSSIGQGSFVAELNDGITDSLVAANGQNLTVKFLQDRNKTPYVLTQGILSVPTEFPSTSPVKATITISAEKESARFSS